jgi:acetylornithine/N-succinyldiaminopimelate aminotransferase
VTDPLATVAPSFADYPVDALMDITDRPPIVFVEGHGSWLVDHTGKRYLDFIQGWAVNCLGHSPAVVADAVAKQARTLINCSPAYYNAPMIELADRLRNKSGLGRVFFANSGGEANEGAIKLARKWGSVHRGGAYEIITMDHAFHGRTLATMSASGKPQWRDLFEPKVPGFPKADLNDIDSVRRLIGEKTVAVMLEPIQGEAGVLPASFDFLQQLRALTEQQGILLIVDEVQTGVGRTGRFFAFQHAGIRPDIMTLAKGIGGGVPLAALLADERVCCFAHGDQGGTFNGAPLATAAGCAVMKELSKPGFIDNVAALGAYLGDKLAALAKKHGFGGTRGQGLLLALELNRDIAPAIVAASFDKGLLINAPRPHLLRFMPALNISREEIDQMTAILDQVVCGLAES